MGAWDTLPLTVRCPKGKVKVSKEERVKEAKEDIARIGTDTPKENVEIKAHHEDQRVTEKGSHPILSGFVTSAMKRDT